MNKLSESGKNFNVEAGFKAEVAFILLLQYLNKYKTADFLIFIS